MNDYIESYINIIISSLIYIRIYFFKQISIFIDNLSEMTTDLVTETLVAC